MKRFTVSTNFNNAPLNFSRVTNLYIPDAVKLESTNYLTPSVQQFECALFQNNVAFLQKSKNVHTNQTSSIYKLLILIYQVNIFLTLFKIKF
jgi:hypothetical protein